MTPLEPLYTLRVAIELIPYPGSVEALRAWLKRHGFAHRYQHVGRAKRRQRLLTRREIAAIRADLVKEIPTGHVLRSRRTVTQANAVRPVHEKRG